MNQLGTTTYNFKDLGGVNDVQFKLDRLSADDDREKITNLYLAKKNQEFFKINNKVDDINHRQLREIKYYAQNMIYRKLFDEFSVEINKRKKQIQ